MVSTTTDWAYGERGYLVVSTTTLEHMGRGHFVVSTTTHWAYGEGALCGVHYYRLGIWGEGVLSGVHYYP